MDTQHSKVVLSVGWGTVWKWSYSHTESKPRRSASWAMWLIASYCAAGSLMWTKSMRQPCGAKTPNLGWSATARALMGAGDNWAIRSVHVVRRARRGKAYALVAPPRSPRAVHGLGRHRCWGSRVSRGRVGMALHRVQSARRIYRWMHHPRTMLCLGTDLEKHIVLGINRLIRVRANHCYGCTAGGGVFPAAGP